MADAVFIATLGNRDLTYRGEVVYPARTKAKELFDLVASEPEQFDMPILLPALRFVVSRAEIDKLVLVVTNQPETVAESERQKDTYFIGKIIRELLSQHFKKFGLEQRPGVKAPEIFQVHENPVFVSNLLTSLKKTYFDKLSQFKDRGVGSMYLLATGGVPSLNTAITLLSNMAFRLNFHLLRVTTQGIAFSDNVSVELGKFDLDSRLRSYINNYDFAAVVREIKRENLTDYPYSQLSSISLYFHKRLLFDFDGAIAEVAQSRSNAGDMAHLQDSLLNELQPAVANFQGNENEKMAFRVSELIQNIYIKFAQQDYVGVAGRMFRMIEELVLILISRAFNKEMIFDKQGYPAFAEIINSNDVLEQAAREKFNKFYSPERFSIDFALLVFKKIIEHSIEVKCPEKISEFLAIYKKYQLGQLKQKRNKSILGHDFKSVTRSDFPDDFYSLLDQLSNLVEIQPPQQRLQKNVQQMLRVLEKHHS